ncbi:MAG: hypothetical protein C0410_11205 [Anaerolinea sp.]|nr:hypothetical protein [Anaerolinea sp.]
MKEHPKQTRATRHQARYLLTIFALMCFSCDERLPLDKLEFSANKQFGNPPAPKQMEPEIANIAVDISESMKGFAETGTFQELIRKTVHALGPQKNVRYYWFDTTYGSARDFLQFFDPNLFVGYATNFQRAFSIRKTGTNEILILLTDFQFNNERSYDALVKAFQTEILKGGYIKVFSSNPDFDGRIFPQFIRKDRFRHKGQRPLYAICVGERSHAEFIEQVLKKTIPWINSVTLSSGIPLYWRIHHPSPTVRISGKSLSLQSRDSLSFKLSLISPVIHDWGDWTRDEIITETFSFIDTNFIEAKENLGVRIIQTKGDTCVITLFAKEIDPTPNKLWRISLRPNSVSPWISDQSCLPDGDQARKTVKLKEFIEDVIRPVTNPFTVNTIHIFLQKD